MAFTSSLTAVENRMTSVSNLVKKTGYNPKINDIEKKITDHNHDKYINTPEFKVNIRKFCCKTKTSKFNKQKWYANFVNNFGNFGNRRKDVTSKKNELNWTIKKS